MKRAREESADEAYGQLGGDDLYHNTSVLRHPSTKRAKEIDADPPFNQLTELLNDQNEPEPRTILHWFRSKDLRQEDNKALAAASRIARKHSVPLIAAYLHSPEDLEWHGTSPARTDFLLESLRILQQQLKEKQIPLAILTSNKRSDKTQTLVDFASKQKVSHIFANYEYEVDELRRDISIIKRLSKDGCDTRMQLFHDQTVVVPGSMTTKAGPHKMFTPYYRVWLTKLEEEPSLLDLEDAPEANDAKIMKNFKDLFDNAIPSIPKSKDFASDDDRKRIRQLWPAGHDAGMKRLEDFLDKKITDYRRDRSIPALDPSSRLSCYFAAGVISVREAIGRAKEWNGGEPNFAKGKSGNGVSSWIRELVFREFYRQRLVTVPHNGMNLPHNLKYDSVQWEDDEDGWKKWCEGKTGVPFIDAGMRQLNHEAYMHNRLRMNVSSYLTNNLLLDYRLGERYFAEHLVDWDLSNNTQGWEPSYTIFNPVLQGEKCDKDGEYIRKWVPELKDVKGKAIFAPHERLSKEDFEKLGYPRPHVDFMESRRRAKERFKRDMAEADP